MNSKKNELSDIRSSIKELEQKLAANNKSEKKNLGMIEDYNKQNLLLNKLINKLRAEEKVKEKEIVQTENEVGTIEEKMNKIKTNYSRYVAYLYKHSKTDLLESIFNSESINQALIRYKYLNEISERRKNDLQSLKQNKTKLSELKDKLVEDKNQKQQMEKAKKQEEKQLQQKLQERKKILASIKKDKSALRDEIDLKKKAEQQIRTLITKLIEDEKKRQAELKRKNEELKKKKDLAIKKNEPVIESVPEIDPTSTLSSYGIEKGKMRWPVDNGNIIRKFGESKNERLNTITLNYGIDIKSRANSDVKAVADGIVSSITWLPGYGVVLILTHKNQFRTVYGHLSEISVNEGDKIESGSIIGKVGESLDGNVLHFEIWNERNNQNPEVWLTRK